MVGVFFPIIVASFMPRGARRDPVPSDFGFDSTAFVVH